MYQNAARKLALNLRATSPSLPLFYLRAYSRRNYATVEISVKEEHSEYLFVHSLRQSLFTDKIFLSYEVKAFFVQLQLFFSLGNPFLLLA